ncbi:uncharacterized protein LOC114313655 [Camellia sinensis]|uniref:uncharacterized protein LOC114313655 n=1 Tax=Camellia sinensis TaxID=4442 RepID=UPI001036AFC0|nr:uncharacterized protein LOC114313655 [Camellia sinensis]
MALDAWKQSDFLCRNYVLNSLADSLFNVFYAKKSTNELWDALDKKYKTEDAGAKKFVVSRFLDFKIVDSKIVINQVQEFQVAALIEKLPNGWKDFKNYLKHKRKEITVEELVGEKKKLSTGKSSKLGEKGSVSTRPVYKPQKPTFRFNGKCLNYGSDRHQAVDCRKKKKPYKKYPPQNKSGPHMAEIEDLSQDVDDMHLATIVTEVNMVGSNPKE